MPAEVVEDTTLDELAVPTDDDAFAVTNAPTLRGATSQTVADVVTNATTPAKPSPPPSLQEPPHFTFDPERPYINPYQPLRQTARPCVNGSHTKGRWVLNASRRPAYPSYGEILGSCERGWQRRLQDQKLHGGGALTVRPETQYEWYPDDCELLRWDEELFCRALRGRDLMLAGDSLNDHWHASLYYLLGGRKDIYRREGTVAGKHACRSHPICAAHYPRPLKLYFLTNQLLSENSMRNRNHKWWRFIKPYPVLILNSGSWMRDPMDEDREVSDEEWAGLMRNALRLVKAQGYNGTVIWRTTYQGHPYCWNYTAPLQAELKAEDFPVVAPYKRYRWAAIPGRNNVTTALWRTAGAHILDVTRPTNLMPLGHLGQNHPKFSVRNVTDCLHYCSPGATYDTWSMLLMNLLAGNLS